VPLVIPLLFCDFEVHMDSSGGNLVKSFPKAASAVRMAPSDFIWPFEVKANFFRYGHFQD
jgi:hypothetical protein